MITRLLGKNEFGVYTLAILLPGILVNFLGFGVSSGIARYAAYHLSRDEPDVAKRMTINGLAFLFSVGLLLSTLCYVGAGPFSTDILHRPDIAGVARFASLYLLALCIFQSMLAALLGWSAMGSISLSNVSHSVMRLAVTAALVLLGFGTLGAIAGYATASFLAAILALAFLWSKMGGRPSGLSGFITDVRTMLSYGYSLFAGQFALNIAAQYVVIVLAAIASNSDVGLYQSAVNITAAISVVSAAMTQTLFPAFAHLQGSEGDIRQAFKYATKYMGFIIAPIIFFLMGSAPQLTDIVYSSAYSAATPYLELLALSNLSLLFGYGVLQSFFNGVGRTRLFMAFALSGAAAQIVLAPLLSIYAGLGIPGLIYSIAVANLIATTCGILLARRYLNAKVEMQSAFSILVTALVSYLALLALRTVQVGDIAQLLLGAVVFAVVYLTVAPVARCHRRRRPRETGGGHGRLGQCEQAILFHHQIRASCDSGRFKPLDLTTLETTRVAFSKVCFLGGLRFILIRWYLRPLEFLGYLVYLGFIFLPGISIGEVLGIFRDSENQTERVALALGLGLAVDTLVLFLRTSGASLFGHESARD